MITSRCSDSCAEGQQTVGSIAVTELLLLPFCIRLTAPMGEVNSKSPSKGGHSETPMYIVEQAIVYPGERRWW